QQFIQKLHSGEPGITRTGGGVMSLIIRSNLSLPVTISVALGFAGVPLTLFADAPAEEATTLGEIIVTAQKREQNLQSVGVSVTALDAQSLAQMNFKDLTEVAGQVPGLQFNQYGATITIYNIRGVSQNDFTDHQEAPVAVYSDDAYIAATGALAG